MANICYRGSLGITLQPGERVTEDASGNRTAVREFVFDYSELNSFISTYTRGTEHPIYPGLYIKTLDWTISGGECRGIVFYEGKEGAGQSNGGATVVSRTLMTRSAEITDNTDGKSYTVQYVAPAATVSWVSFSDVRGPAKLEEAEMGTEAAPNAVTKSAVKIAAAIPTDSEVAPPADATTFFTADTDYEIKIVSDGFQTTPISGDGSRWNVTETWAAVIVEKSS